MNPDFRGILGAATTVFGTIVGWEAQLEFGLRILSLIVAIIAGIYTILHYARSDKK